MAKVNPLVLLLVVLVIAFFLLVLTSSNNYVPYNSTVTNYAKYEPMTEISGMDSGPVGVQSASSVNNGDVKSELKKVPEKSSPSNDESKNVTSKPSSILPAIFGNGSTENFAPIVDVAQTIQYGPLRDSEIIDKFSQVTKNGVDGVDGCVSSGLSNSSGYICLTPELIDLLKTRGGNASGKI